MCAKHLSSQDHFHQDFEFINFWCLHSCQSSMYSLPSSFHWQEQGGDWRGETGTFVACDAPFSCLWWVKGNINAFQSGSLSFARMSCTATPFRFEVWGTGQAGYCLRLIRERGGWVGGVKDPILQSKLLSLSHFTPCIHNNTHPLQSHPLFYFQGFRVLAAIFSSFSTHTESHSSSPSHIHPIKESFCAEHLVVCKLWSSFWAAATSATVSSWLTTRTGSPAAPQPLVSDAGSPPLAPSLDLSLLSCNGCYLSISSANFAQAIFHLVFAPKTTQALHQRVNKISACSSLVFHFMLFLHCSHKLHWGVRNLVALAGAWDTIANLRVEKYQRDGRYENCRCL